LSADDYFMKDGEYVFVPQLLSEAHGNCFRLFLNALMPDELLPELYAKTLLIVDNTNITAMEASPYMLAAQAAGVSAAIYSRWADPSVAAKHNIHEVPEELIFRMAANYLSEHLPMWWRKLHDLKAIRGWIAEPERPIDIA
jgi:hypothetical protein